MEFNINMEASKNFIFGSKISYINLASDWLQQNTNNYLLYEIYFKELDSYIFVSVSCKHNEDGKYNIIFSKTAFTGDTLKMFIDYLKSNHKRNIAELSI